MVTKVQMETAMEAAGQSIGLRFVGQDELEPLSIPCILQVTDTHIIVDVGELEGEDGRAVMFAPDERIDLLDLAAVGVFGQMAVQCWGELVLPEWTNGAWKRGVNCTVEKCAQGYVVVSHDIQMAVYCGVTESECWAWIRS